MVDFEKFEVYKLSEETYSLIIPILRNVTVDLSFKDQLRRASRSISFNIAEGAGKFGKRDKQKYYLIARGSALEVISIIRLLKLEEFINEETYLQIYNNLHTIVRMLSGLVKSLNK